MADEVEMSQLLKDMLAHEEGTAAEELRVALNDIIAKHQLHASVVISLLARLSAGYIHLTQKYYNSLNADVVVEEDFQNILTAHLTELDMSDVKDEVEKIKKENLN